MGIKTKLARVILSKLSWATINEAINAINVRLKRLAKVFGKNSETFKKEVAFMQKGSLHNYLGESKAGNLKVDYMKIKKALQSGRLDLNQANEILTRLAGVKINEQGEVTRTGTGVKTVGQLRSEAREKMQDMGAEEYDVDDFIEKLNKFATEFQSAYNSTIRDVGAERMENEPVVGQLWSKNRTKQGRLSYPDLAKIMKGMEELRNESKMQEGWVEANVEDIPF